MDDLEDDELAAMAATASKQGGLLGRMVGSMAAEIRRRRAADLSAADRELLAMVRSLLVEEHECGTESEVKLLDRLIGDGG
jgi:hypothetical protein